MRKIVFCRVLPMLLFALVAVSSVMSAEKTVDLTATDGIKLKASFFPAAKPGPGVLLLHQCNRDRKSWDVLAQRLAASGINVLTFDLRAFGESGDTPRDKATQDETRAELAKWPGDVDAAFQYLVTQPGVKKDLIGVGGASCGVNNSIQAAIRHPEQVRSLVLLAGPTDSAGRQFLRKTSTVPVLFGYADDDEFPDSITDIQWLYSLDASPGKKMVRYADGKHGAEIFDVHPEFVQVITDWYVTTLIKTPGHALPSPPFALPQQVQTLTTLDQPGGVAKVEAQLKEARQQDPKAKLFPEEQVNIMGYERLQAGETEAALEIFKLNALAYPGSPNVYDSLGDAYLAAGQKDLARDSAKMTLEVLASDTMDDQQRRDLIKASAEQKLKQLGDEGQTKAQ